MIGLRNLLFSGFNWVGDALRYLLESVWSAVLLLLDTLMGVVVTLIGLVFSFLVYTLGVLLQALLALLPDGISADHTGLSGLSSLGVANQYVPVAEVVVLLPLMAAALAAAALYKLVKLIRGGG